MIESFFKKTLLMAIGIIAAFLMAEAAIRISGYAWYDYRIIDKATGLLILKPSGDFKIKKSCFEHEIKTNQLGFHSKYYDENKPDGVFRIAVLGDSFTEGLQVPLEKTFSYLLEQKLNNDAVKRKYEVMSFGIAGSGAYQHISYYKTYVKKFNPDLVIKTFVSWNDILDDAMSSDEPPIFNESGRLISTFTRYSDKQQQRPTTELKKLMRRSAVIMTLYKKLSEIKSKTVLINENLPLHQQIFLKNYPEEWQKGWEIEKKLLLNLNNDINEDGFQFLLVSLVEGARVEDAGLTAFENSFSGYEYDLEKPERLLEEFSAAEKISYLPLLSIFKYNMEKTPQRISTVCDGHWNETGHEWAAQGIYRFLADNGYLVKN
ncbi:SGNH/GDSL hydrolase family protein [Candidatus Parcubacteria bacterium]|nr:MAG: SGNH/GDSL hydrolase family protein [Candidatus Parcubacteria bacterium]